MVQRARRARDSPTRPGRSSRPRRRHKRDQSPAARWGERGCIPPQQALHCWNLSSSANDAAHGGGEQQHVTWSYTRQRGMDRGGLGDGGRTDGLASGRRSRCEQPWHHGGNDACDCSTGCRTERTPGSGAHRGRQGQPGHKPQGKGLRGRSWGTGLTGVDRGPRAPSLAVPGLGAPSHRGLIVALHEKGDFRQAT